MNECSLHADKVNAFKWCGLTLKDAKFNKKNAMRKSYTKQPEGSAVIYNWINHYSI